MAPTFQPNPLFQTTLVQWTDDEGEYATMLGLVKSTSPSNTTLIPAMSAGFNPSGQTHIPMSQTHRIEFEANLYS